MISERTLRNWRRDALRKIQPGALIPASTINRPEGLNVDVMYTVELNERILRLTQELLDQHLMKGK